MRKQFGAAAAGTAAVAVAAALALPGMANAEGSVSAGSLASVAEVVPSGSAGSLMDLTALMANDISAPDVSVEAGDNGGTLDITLKNTNPIVSDRESRGFVRCSTLLLPASDAPGGLADALSHVPSHAVFAQADNVAGDTEDTGSVLSGSETYTDGDYGVYTVCQEIGALHGVGGTGTRFVPASWYNNADVTLDGGTFTVTPASGGSGSGSGSSDMFSGLSSASD